MRLKAKHSRKFYKSDRQYIRAVFNANKRKIIENIGTEWIEKYYENADEANFYRKQYLQTKKKPSNMNQAWENKYVERVAYKEFKELVESQMAYTNPKTEKKYTVEEAILRESRSKDLNKEWTTADVYARNFHELVKKNSDIKEVFYQHEGIKRIDYSQYNFMGYYKYKGKDVAVYNYGDSYFLEYQSPQDKEGQGATLQYLSGWAWQRALDQAELAPVAWRKRK